MIHIYFYGNIISYVIPNDFANFIRRSINYRVATITHNYF